MVHHRSCRNRGTTRNRTGPIGPGVDTSGREGRPDVKGCWAPPWLPDRISSEESFGSEGNVDRALRKTGGKRSFAREADFGTFSEQRLSRSKTAPSFWRKNKERLRRL